MRSLWLLPAAVAVVTGIGTGIFVQQHQPDYPIQAAIFQIMMVGAALLVTVPQPWVRLLSPLLLMCGAFVAGMSIGMFYLPTVVVAGLVAARRLNENRATPSFLDAKPQDGIIYTETEVDAMNHRQSR